MAWGDKKNNNDKGPWGKFSGGGNNPGGNNRGGNNQKGPDFDELAKKFNDKFKNFFDNNKGGSGTRGAKPVFIIIAGLIILWLVGGFYKVDPDEQAVILRFGKFS